MINQLKLFLFVLSIVFQLRFIIEFIFKFFQEEPTPLEIKPMEKVFLYLATSYTITYFLI